MKKKPVILLIIFIIVNFRTHSIAQSENNVWYFGLKSGLDFNYNPAKVLVDNPTIESPYLYSPNNYSGSIFSSTICDYTGNMIIHTDGVNIWNRDRQMMPGGMQIVQTRSLGTIIIPIPTTTKFYVFSIASSSRSIVYSIVDINLDNGKGAVISSQNSLYGSVSNQLIGIGADDCGVWLITHKLYSGDFVAFKIDKDRINAPVISTVGATYYTFDRVDQQMKSSHDGKRIAVATQKSAPSLNDQFGSTAICELYNFNNATGVVSNPIKIYKKPNPFNGADNIEFSPDNKFLYTSYGFCINAPVHSNDTCYAYINQYDISSNNETQITNSAVNLLAGGMPDADLLLGRDAKIYSAFYSYTLFDNAIFSTGSTNYYTLSVINLPNEKGIACNAKINAVDLQGGHSSHHLPNLLRNYNKHTIDFNYSHACKYDSTEFSVNNINNYNYLQWDFGDIISGVNNTSNLPNPKHFYSTDDYYNVTLTYGNCSTTMQIKISNKIKVNIVADTTICNGDSIHLNSNFPNNANLWNTGQETNSIYASKKGLYKVTVTNTCNTDSDSMYLNIIPTIYSKLKDTIVCDLSEMILKPFPYQEGLNYLWNNGEITSEILIHNAQRYSLKMSNECFIANEVANVYFSSSNGEATHQNLITVNGDNKNEVYIPFKNTVGLNNYKMEIYNSWGSIIYESTDPDKYWEALSVSDGVYFYNTQFKNCKNEDISQKGWIQVLR